MAILDKIRQDLRMQQWNMQTIAWTLVFILIIIQAFGILFANVVSIKLGPVLLFALIAVSVLLAAAIAKKQWAGRTIDRKDFFALLILVIVTVLAVMYLDTFVPQVFSVAAEALKHDLQSVLPLP